MTTSLEDENNALRQSNTHMNSQIGSLLHENQKLRKAVEFIVATMDVVKADDRAQTFLDKAPKPMAHDIVNKLSEVYTMLKKALEKEDLTAKKAD